MLHLLMFIFKMNPLRSTVTIRIMRVTKWVFISQKRGSRHYQHGKSGFNG